MERLRTRGSLGDKGRSPALCHQGARREADSGQCWKTAGKWPRTSQVWLYLGLQIQGAQQIPSKINLKDPYPDTSLSHCSKIKTMKKYLESSQRKVAHYPEDTNLNVRGPEEVRWHILGWKEKKCHEDERRTVSDEGKSRGLIEAG